MRVVLLIILISCISCTGSPGTPVQPEVLNTETSQVTIAWLSNDYYSGTIFYKPTGSQAAYKKVTEQFGQSNRHEIMLGGLLPNTRYSYRVGEKGKSYQFKTKPGQQVPFSFLMVYGDVSGEILPLTMNEVFDFYITLNPPQTVGDWFAASRPYVPVFNMNGVDSVFQRTLDSAPKTAHNGGPGRTWMLDWGGLRLIFIDDVNKLPPLLKTKVPHTFGLIASSRAIAQDGRPLADAPAEDLKNSRFHQALCAHNAQNPNRPAAFVWLVGKEFQTYNLESNGIVYTALADINTANSGGVIRVDVDVESSRAFFQTENKTLVLRKPLLKEKRSCRECRLLADKGAYEESITAYEEFIKNNAGHFQIDDAYFAIAGIYEEKLFRFIDAVSWYQRLAAEYPEGNLTQLAKQRLTFLMRYADNDYKPLQRFERIRKTAFSGGPQEQRQQISDVEAIIAAFPHSALAPVMLHWCANRLRSVSTAEAVTAYRKLQEKYPLSPETKDVLLEIAETYYDAQQNHSALEAYEQALIALPAMEKTIKAQMNRAKRNIFRDRLALILLILFCLPAGFVFFKKPRGLVLTAAKVRLLPVLVLCSLLGFGAWMIREQFTTTTELLLLVILPALNVWVTIILSTNFVYKIHAPDPIQGRGYALLSGGLMGLLIFSAGFYLTLYFVNSHYLILLYL